MEIFFHENFSYLASPYRPAAAPKGAQISDTQKGQDKTAFRKINFPRSFFSYPAAHYRLAAAPKGTQIPQSVVWRAPSTLVRNIDNILQDIDNILQDMETIWKEMNIPHLKSLYIFVHLFPCSNGHYYWFEQYIYREFGQNI